MRLKSKLVKDGYQPQAVVVSEVLQRRYSGRKNVSRYRQEHPECEVCGWSFGGSRGIDVHHIVPIATNGELSEDNLISLCPNHHKVAHIVGLSRFGRYYGPVGKPQLIEAIKAGKRVEWPAAITREVEDMVRSTRRGVKQEHFEIDEGGFTRKRQTRTGEG